jgi:Ran GTPase-activating protein (RanGAP) involved in mRNA processing and transport
MFNSTLLEIDLRGNDFGDEGAKAVAEAIEVNSTLQAIDLGINGIGAKGAKAVAEALKVNSTLQTIELEGNYTGNDLISQIAETLNEIRLRKEMNYRILICAFTASHVDFVRLRFDKMMLRFVYYPILFED